MAGYERRTDTEETLKGRFYAHREPHEEEKEEEEAEVEFSLCAQELLVRIPFNAINIRFGAHTT